MPRFCARCGVEESENIKIIGYLCQNCFLREKGLAIIPQRIDLVICPVCGSIKIGDSWFSQEDFNNDLRIPISMILNSKLKPSNEFVDYVSIRSVELIGDEENLRAKIIVEGRAGGVILTKDYITNIAIVRKICPVCRARRSESYEAVVQVRGFPRLSQSTAMRIMNYVDSLPRSMREFIVKIDRLREGLDLKISSKSSAIYIANLIAKEYVGVITSITDEDVRETPRGRFSKKIISVRVIDLEEGKRLTIRGEPYIFEKRVKDEIYLINRNGEKIKYSIRDLLKIIARE
ncbi:MAG: 60S ribosomal export protein NMD3 [Sulfolobales archaeon]